MVVLPEISLFQDLGSCEALDSQSIPGECDHLQTVLYSLVSASESFSSEEQDSKQVKKRA